MVMASSGGRYCFWRMMAGPSGRSRMARMPTPSILEVAGRVGRSACSHVLSTPLGSLYVVLQRVSMGELVKRVG